MAISFKFYLDSALTSQVSSGNPISATQDTLGSLSPVDVQVWFGSTATTTTVQATSDPGVDQITVSISDSGSGSGEPAAAIKLALTQGGLATATAGASLDLGTSVDSGSANAVSFWVRLDDQTATVGTYTDLSLVTNDLTETAA